MEIQNNRIERTTFVLSSVIMIIVFIISGARSFFIQEENNKNQRQETQKLIDLNNLVRPFTNEKNVNFFYQESEKIKNKLFLYLAGAFIMTLLISFAFVIRCRTKENNAQLPQQ